MLIDGKTIFDLADCQEQYEKEQNAKSYLDSNANLLFLRYVLPKLVECKQLDIPITISVFAKKCDATNLPQQLTCYEKGLYIIDTNQFENNSIKIWCNLVELSAFFLETGLDINIIFLNDDEVKLKISKTLVKEKKLLKSQDFS